MKRRKNLSLVVAVGILIVAVSLSFFFASQKKPPLKQVQQKAKNYVKTKKITYQDIATDIVAYGRVETAHSLDLLSEVSGRMYAGKIRLKKGQTFRKGDLLFYLDSQEEQLNLKSQKSNFLRDFANILPDLKLDFVDSYEKWHTFYKELDIDQKFPILPKVTSEKEKTYLATKGIYSAYFAIKSAEVRLAKYHYFAPFDGSISEITLESGSFINPGTKIGTILRSGIHELKVSVDVEKIKWIQKEAPVKIYADNNFSWDGKVDRISDHVNQNTQSIDVFVSVFPKKNQEIYDGQFLKTSIQSRVIKNGMEVPRNIIYNGNEVFILKDTLLKVQTVDILQTTEENAVIKGLTEGEDLVIEPLIGAHNDKVAFKFDEKEITIKNKKKSE